MYAAHCTMIGVRCTVYYDTMQYISYKVRCSHLFRTLLCVKYTRTLYVVQCTSYKVPSYGLQSTVFTFIPYTVMYTIHTYNVRRTKYGVMAYNVRCSHLFRMLLTLTLYKVYCVLQYTCTKPRKCTLYNILCNKGKCIYYCEHYAMKMK